MIQFSIIGVMSGTSLDGMDVAFCNLSRTSSGWHYTLGPAETITYSPQWSEQLATAHQLHGEALTRLHHAYGHYTGEVIHNFIQRHHLVVDYVASHGHTIHHRPDAGFTLQIGSGAAISSACGVPVICDFRTTDVALGGQGAPLVPVGDQLLFNNYSYALNIGGFANISLAKDGERMAWDICPANFVLNMLSRKMGMPYDENGNIARRGEAIPTLLQQLNQLPYYHMNPPKSLGREWVEEQILPLLNRENTTADILHTFTEHIAQQIGAATSSHKGNMLVTGGGAFNSYLMERIAAHSPCQVIIPSPDLINYKEALVFALLGALRVLGEPNCLASVTGARRDNVGGCIYLP